MSNVWDNVVASASKAMTHAGEATQTAATKAKLNADILLIDRDIQSRKEKFGVDMYAHLENITSTQEFYVADDRLINVIRPTLIRAQKEVAAYERKRDAMKGKVNMAETNRAGSASILGAETIGQKFLNAVNFASAGAKEMSLRTELAMVERQILGFKEEFGTELYPIFQSMEDNEGWLPTDRKVRSLYDAAREDIAGMEKAKELKREQMQALGTSENAGFSPPQPTVAPTHGIAPAPAPGSGSGSGVNNYNVGNGQAPWASAAPSSGNSPATTTNYGSSYGAPQTGSSSYGATVPSKSCCAPQQIASSSYGASQQPFSSSYGAPQPMSENSFGASDMHQLPQQNQPSNNKSSGFGFMQSQSTNSIHPGIQQTTQTTIANNSTSTSYHDSFQRPVTQNQQTGGADGGHSFNPTSVFDPFDGMESAKTINSANLQISANGNAFDPFSGSSQNGSSTRLSDADMNLFKF